MATETRSAIARGWTRLGDSRALIVGGLALGGAVIWGAAQAGITSAVLYRMFRKRRHRGSSAKRAANALADTSLRWVARVAIPVASAPALAIRIAQVFALSYFGLRAIDERQKAQRQLASGAQPVALHAAG